MKGPLLLPLTLLVLLAGCALGPDYRRPAPSAGPPPARFTAATPVVSPAAPPDDWWRLYDDPALDALVRRALAANTDLRVALANLDAARAALDLARVARVPSTNVSAGAQYGVTTAELAAARAGRRDPQADWTFAPGFSASWEIDLFGRVRRSIEAARADAEASEAAADAVRVTIAAETARAYADACAFANAAGVQRRSIAVADRGVTLTAVQRRAGAISGLELARAQALAQATRAPLPGLEAQRQNALFRLAVLTGTAPEAIPPSAAACIRPLALAEPIPVGDGVALIARRPDIRQAERRLAGDTARIGVATAALYPTISLGGAVTSAANGIGGLANSTNRTFAIGPLLSWAFPNIGGARARIRGANAQAAASLAAFDGAVLAALRDVEQALATNAAELDRHSALAGARARDAQALAFADRQYRDGAISYLNLLDAQRTLIADDNALALSNQLVSTNQILLFKALGGGWRTSAAIPISRTGVTP
jgi:NodT family efflux transporter outer membrane factor (OMF) lipoprotein